MEHFYKETGGYAPDMVGLGLNDDLRHIWIQTGNGMEVTEHKINKAEAVELIEWLQQAVPLMKEPGESEE